MQQTAPRFLIAALDPQDKFLEVTWQDGHVSRYPHIWLLEACSCEQCGNTQTAVRHTRLTCKPRRPGPGTYSFDDTRLSIGWDDKHRSNYALDWLRSMCLSEQGRRERKFQPLLWGREMATQLPYMNYAEVSTSTLQQQRFLESILYRGFAILRGVPAAREQTEEIAALVGKLRLTNYEIYELESKPKPEIVADMTISLAPHTDEPYRVDPPAITFFHVIKQSDCGGESTLLDSFRLVELLKQRNPEAFEILSRVSAGFHRNLVEGRMFAYQHPVIQLDGDGDLSAVRLLDRAMTPVDCALELVEPFYDALRELLALSYGGEGMIEIKLQAGEILVFNNQRLMHGRNEFDSSTSSRHIRSCHVDLDEFYSRLRILYADCQDPRRWMTFRKD